jgi:hypothetical protein
MLWIAASSFVAMAVAFAFGRRFKGGFGKVMDFLVFLAGFQAALPCFLLLSTPAVAWFVGTWVIGWQGAYHIGNIENGKVRWPLIAIWVATFTVLMIRLKNGMTPAEA